MSEGIQLPCPKCWQDEASVSLHLDDMQTFTCRDCETEFTRDDVAAFIAKWTPVLKWIEQAPKAG